ncbi:MAG TPA: DnaA regulatory inactivator Hda [Oxalobacteraceae bacterium]|nr:DnaA regulatory inactivator Hda [Oxalobacteraceae bacterium]
MRQLLLDLGAEKPQTLDTFVVGQNEELHQLLRVLERRAATSLAERFVYVWAAPGAGKTHLLRALAASPSAHYIGADAALDAFLPAPGVTLYLLDDCERFAAEAQIAAFNLFNLVREQGGALLASGSVAPAILPVREDLRTRLGWGLIYQIHELTDDEKIAALTHSAQARGLALSAGVLPYLITHFRRDMRSLSAMLDALDQYSLETKRPITLPLLRSLLLTGLEGEPTA